MKMRNIIMAGICSLAMVSCNYLDFDETNKAQSKEDMFAVFANVQQMLTNVYSYMPEYDGFRTAATIDNLAMRDAASDDVEFGTTSATVQNVNNGNWSAVSTYDDAWTLYGGIRAANEFIVEVENVDISDTFINGNYKQQLEQLGYYPYEARVLRAYYFFELARRYGDIAMPTKVLSIDEANTIGKTPFSEVIDFIVSECDECAAKLPADYKNVSQQQVGRTTKGFALALKTKALLYAASPLHNPGNDKELWKAAARAAKEVMDLGIYSLDPATCFNKTESSELILARMNGRSSLYERYNFPVRLTYGTRTATFVAAGNYPSQNLVDAFETKNGYKVTLTADGWVCDDPQFDPQKPYDNRDPRFARTILADGMSLRGETLAVYAGGDDDVSVSLGGSATGYFVRKFLNEDANFDPEASGAVPESNHHWVLYRYAETLLSYAEAMVNAFESGTYVDTEFKVSALDALNEVRRNASMPAVSGGTKEQLLESIRNEWRVEFALEDHRFWDVRRWKLGADTQTQLYGVYIVRNLDGTKTYRQRLVENRTWREAMYLYPIPQAELFKNTNLYPQNPGW